MGRDRRNPLGKLAARRLAAKSDSPGFLLASLSEQEFEAQLIHFERRLEVVPDSAAPLTAEEKAAQLQRIAAGLNAIGHARASRIFTSLLKSRRAKGDANADAFEAHLRRRGILGEAGR